MSDVGKKGTGKNGTNKRLEKIAHLLKSTFKKQEFLGKFFFSYFINFTVHTAEC